MNDNNFLHWNVCNHDQYTPRKKQETNPEIKRHQKQGINKYRKGRKERDSWNRERECGRISRLPDDQRQR